MSDKNNPFDIDVSDSEIYSKVLEKPVPCMLLNKNLSTDTVAKLATMFHVVDVQHDDETYFAVVLGLYKQPEPGSKVAAKVLDPWGNLTLAVPPQE